MEPLQNQGVSQNNPFQPAPASSTPTNPTLNNQTPANNVPSDVNRNILSGEHHKKVGPIVATLIIVLIIIIGIIYIFASKVNQQVPIDAATAGLSANTQVNQNNNVAPTPTTVATVVPVTGTSDDLQSLQTDLNASVTGVDGQGI